MRGQVTQSSSLAPRPQTQTGGKSSSNGKSRRGRSPSGKRYQKSVESVMWLLAFSHMSWLRGWIGMHIRRKVRIQAQRGWQSTQQEAEEKWWKRVCCRIEEFEAIGLRIPGYGAADIQVDVTEEHQNSWDRSAACTSQKVSYSTSAFSTTRAWLLCSNTWGQISGYLRTDFRKWREMSTSSKKRTKPHILLTFSSLVMTSAIFDETRGQRNCGRFQSIRAHAE